MYIAYYVGRCEPEKVYPFIFLQISVTIILRFTFERSRTMNETAMNQDSRMPVISLRHVDKHFGQLHVLKDINLDVHKGEMDDGRILEENTPDAFFTSPQTERARDFLRSIGGH